MLPLAELARYAEQDSTWPLTPSYLWANTLLASKDRPLELAWPSAMSSPISRTTLTVGTASVAGKPRPTWALIW